MRIDRPHHRSLSPTPGQSALKLSRALDDIVSRLAPLSPGEWVTAAGAGAGVACGEDVTLNRWIGDAGLPWMAPFHHRLDRRVSILPHHNAGWLAKIDGDAARAPIYEADESGVALRVLGDETPPRKQGR